MHPVIARVLPDLPAVEKVFDYLVPASMRDDVEIGTIVRIELHGRRVRGWVVDLPEEPAPGVELKPLAKVTGSGPPPEVVDLARWAAWRWAGRWVHLLRAASPPASVRTVAPVFIGERHDRPEPVVRRLPPAADRLALVADAVADGPAIVVVPSVDLAMRLAHRLRRDGHRIALHAGDVTVADWIAAQRGDASVIGTRIAVWAPMPDAVLRRIVVLDEHDEALQSESAPTWHARDVAIERARRARVPCTLVSPVPTMHALAAGRLEVPAGERAGWPVVEVADRRNEEPVRAGLFSPRLATLLADTRRDGGRVVCVLNRLGRSRLLACRACGSVAACARCGAAVAQPEPGQLVCNACGEIRPLVCDECGSGRFRNLRAGVARAREELEALAGEPVVEVTGTAGDPADARIAVGTEAVLHRLAAGSVAVAAFLDLDQELLAPRYRAAEQALALVARAARAVSPRDAGGRLLLQTRIPEHAVVRSAVRGDPGVFAAGELERRHSLRYPPAAALALVSGAGAEDWAMAATQEQPPLGIEVLGPADGRWLIRAPDPTRLADWLATIPRPPKRLRIEVDPPRA